MNLTETIPGFLLVFVALWGGSWLLYRYYQRVWYITMGASGMVGATLAIVERDTTRTIIYAVCALLILVGFIMRRRMARKERARDEASKEIAP